MKEREVQFKSISGMNIFGTLTQPTSMDQRRPAILLVPGSGPLDRNGNGKRKSQTLNLYNQLASFLTEQGFITLRYDKRGTGKSEASFMETGFWDLVEDARAAIQTLKEEPAVDPKRIFVIGHSEGGILAPEIVKGHNLAGLILVAGAAQSLPEALAFQREQTVQELKNVKGIKGKLLSLFNVGEKAEKQGQKFDQKILRSTKDVVRYQGIKINAKWFREHATYNIYEGLVEIDCPVLAVTGSKDLQVMPERVYETVKYTKVETEAHIVDGMNHMLRDQADDVGILQLKKAYKDVGSQPLSPPFLELVKMWLNKHVSSG
ncbi:alpha/beta hydrolase [Halalkalibacter alkalisediminis]|uniref:Alpha/beta hydrolase n=1 Tax=Halalkalibacter alkalisediminis TaxID=935616 RepID=A0ABV6NE05_9BACI|nr:alpha/beta fold hydrolase [Halalkalibacter alkalisediminis]